MKIKYSQVCTVFEKLGGHRISKNLLSLCFIPLEKSSPFHCSFPRHRCHHVRFSVRATLLCSRFEHCVGVNNPGKKLSSLFCGKVTNVPFISLIVQKFQKSQSNIFSEITCRCFRHVNFAEGLFTDLKLRISDRLCYESLIPPSWSH